MTPMYAVWLAMKDERPSVERPRRSKYDKRGDLKVKS